MKTLEKLERIEKPTKVSGPNIFFGEVMRSGDNVFHVEDLKKAYVDVDGPDPDGFIVGSFIRSEGADWEVWRNKVLGRLRELNLVP